MRDTSSRLQGPFDSDVESDIAALLQDRSGLFEGIGGGNHPTPDVLASWKRCVRYGLNPSGIAPLTADLRERGEQLIAATDAALASRSRIDQLQSLGMCLSLTDDQGVILKQWAGGAPIMKTLEGLDVVAGFSVDEATVGTSSGSSLISRKPTLVRGPEHFAPQFSDLTSAGNAVVHPITRQLLGSLNLTCSVDDSSPLALSWVQEIVADIEATLLESATVSERLLLAQFLRENRDARHPVVAVNARTVMANASATRLLGAVDQAMLWDHAKTTFADRTRSVSVMSLDGGVRIQVERSFVTGPTSDEGVVLRLSRLHEPARRPDLATVSLPGLSGNGHTWNRMRHELARATDSSILLYGDPGTGKASVARCIAGRDAAAFDGDDASPEWLEHIAGSANEGRALVLLHLDRIPNQWRLRLASILTTTAVRVVATSGRPPASGALGDHLQVCFPDVIAVPSLTERPEDLSSIVENLSLRHSRAANPPRWMPDAIQALARVDWPENIRSLNLVVAQVLSKVRHDYVGIGDLPVQIHRRGARRRLSGLERMEADAILQALRDSGDNKKLASEALGIARSTLYRKMRALGIDSAIV
ncbi:sigma-54-dependent Fis family transcriptional regulator [Rhodococcus sp. NPDC003382]|uniref:sigma-54-dependent Fis family transcriptional regulator n=1 Tax=Rhodococcus zopfii TaxID=43772 RepID=UPI001EDE7671|nr:helix-turn-helix domain-containing protein [Rhodococcus zopfii]